MTPKQFARLLERDLYCLHCGRDDNTLTVNHRANRGHGGSKKADRASNYVLMCSLFNGLIESDAKAAGLALRYGWKLSRYDKPQEKPVYDVMSGKWFFLNDDFTREELLT